MKLLGKLEKNRGCWFVILSSVLFFLLRLPSLFEPNWYGDEGVYQVLGIAINHGRLLYRDIWDNKPPFLYMLYSAVSSDQFAIRFLSLIFGLLSVFVFFLLAKKIFKKAASNKPAFVSTGIFTLLFGLPLLEGNIANAENFLVLPVLISALLVFESRGNLRTLFIAGLFASFAFLFKIVGLFDFAAFFVFIFITSITKINKKYIIAESEKLITLSLGFIIPIFGVALFFLFQKDAFPFFLNATFFANIGYVGYGNQFLFPQGLLVLKLILLAATTGILFRYRNRVGAPEIFILTWLAFSLFSAFFSGRPYTHYLLVLISSFSLLAGLIVYDKKLQKIHLVILVLSIILVYKNFSFFTKIPGYYGNFVSFVTNNKSVLEYRNFFDRQTPIDYEVANYIMLHTTKDENVFVWGNNPQIYKMANKLPPGKYTVAYHITGYKDGITETTEKLRVANPKLIIIMPYMKNYPFSLLNYHEKIIIQGVLIYERNI